MMSGQKVELLAPAGNMERFYTALHFGADAVYLSGKQFGLRAFADNFTLQQIQSCSLYAHSLNKKVYVTVNIFAFEEDIEALKQYLTELDKCGIDAVIVSDIGIMQLIKQLGLNLEIHLSTQANATNSLAVEFYKQQGVKRVVLARECTLNDIKNIVSKSDIDIEAFIHGAMCISYSGRCLLSDYMTGRRSNHGECVQACRWQYKLSEGDREIIIDEDSNGSYLLNSKDLNMLPYVDKLIESGIASFKMEGRMKSSYYVATVTNAYRRAIDAYYNGTFNEELVDRLSLELDKASHRKYTTGFYFNDQDDSRELQQYYLSSKAVSDVDFVATVVECKDGIVTVEQRNRFYSGETLEILSNGDSFNKRITVPTMRDDKGREVTDAKLVQQLLTFECPYKLLPNDMLRSIK